MKGKVVIVTGATKGMGFGCAKRLLEEGSKVVFVYANDKDRADQVEELLSGYKNNMLLLKADITVDANREDILNKTIAKFGRIDVLVNNAGVAAKHGFSNIEEKEYDKILDVNLKAPIFLAQIISRKMIEQGDGGSIINFSSISGHRGCNTIAYEAAKAGLIIATQSMAVELGKHKIRVNSISPGYHKTEMNRYHWENQTDLHQNVIKTIPLGDASDAADIAGTVIYLASDLSKYVTGIDIIVDGGYMCVLPARDI